MHRILLVLLSVLSLATILGCFGGTDCNGDPLDPKIGSADAIAFPDNPLPAMSDGVGKITVKATISGSTVATVSIDGGGRHLTGTMSLTSSALNLYNYEVAVPIPDNLTTSPITYTVKITTQFQTNYSVGTVQQLGVGLNAK